MSTLSYNKWWIQTKTNLKNLKQYDLQMKKITKSTKERSLASHLIGGLFAKYSRVVQDVDACLDQMCQVQRGVTVRKLMNAATQRLHELKQYMVEIDISEYHYIDGALIELKLIPHDIEILHPALFYPRPLEIQDMWGKIQAGENIYIPPVIQPAVEVELAAHKADDPNINGSHAAVVTEEIKDDKDKKKKEKKKMKFIVAVPKLSDEEEEAAKLREVISQAVRIIQSNERARQGRLYSIDIDNIRKEREAMKFKKTLGSDTNTICASAQSTTTTTNMEDPVLNEKSSLALQKMWRGHAVRSKLKYEERRRRLLIQMTEPSWKSTEEFEKLEKTAEVRQKYRDDKIKEYIETKLAEKDRVLRVIGPGLFEDIGDEIREWFHDWYDNAKNFDKYPPVEKGGTVIVVRGETMTPQEWIDEVERKRRERVKNAGLSQGDKDKEKADKEKKKKEAAATKKKETEKKKKAAAALKKKKLSSFEFEFDKVSPQLTALTDGLHENHILWNDRNINDNPLDMPYMDIITDEKCYELQLEIRGQVDEMMRLELELLNDALARDRAKAKKGKKGKKGGKNKKKGKKGKKGQKGKKDPTGHRTTEDLFQELYDNGIIRTYPKASMDQFRADFSYCNWEKRNTGFDPPATLGDVRQAVILNCVLPLGVEVMDKPKSVIIAGPHQSGKHMIANAIFNATKCVLFDVSPPILAGKYTGKEGMKMLIHLLNKMSKLLQPSIIFVDGAEKPFYKKVPKDEKALDPKRLGGKLFKNIVKPITKEHRVLVLGITHQPWAGKPAGMKKAYQKVILIPRPDYGSVFLYWRELLMPFHGIDREINFTALTTLTQTYPLSAIKAAVEQLITPRRLIRFAYDPLRQAELLYVLMMGPLQPMAEKEWKKFIKWYNKTPMGKSRVKMMKVAEEKRQMELKMAEKEEAKNKKR